MTRMGGRGRRERGPWRTSVVLFCAVSWPGLSCGMFWVLCCDPFWSCCSCIVNGSGSRSGSGGGGSPLAFRVLFLSFIPSSSSFRVLCLVPFSSSFSFHIFTPVSSSRFSRPVSQTFLFLSFLILALRLVLLVFFFASSSRFLASRVFFLAFLPASPFHLSVASRLILYQAFLVAKWPS